MKIKKNDTVLVISGKDRGKKGKIRYAYPKDNRVLVEGVNMIKRHTKPGGQNKPGGIVEREAPFYAANVMYFCGKCNHPSRIGYKFLDDGRKVRICRACQEVID